MKFSLFVTALIVIFIVLMSVLNKNTDDTIVLKFSTWGSKSEIDVVKECVDSFEQANPNIKVKLIHIPQNYLQKIQLLFASGLEPDVVFINNQNTAMYVNAGLLEDLSPYFNDTKDFYKEALDCFKYNEKIYTIPRDISNLVIYYNKDIFKRQNIKMPSKIKDIFELRQIAKNLTSNKNFGINFESNSLYWNYYLASNGGGIVSDDKKRIIINSKKSLEALNLYSDMINKDKSMPSKADLGSMTSAQMFINGKIAMYLSGRWMVPKFRETINFDWDVIEFPAPNKVYIDSSGWAISKKSKYKKEAVDLIKYLSSKEIIEKFSSSGLIVPARKDVQFQGKNQKPENFKSFTDMIKNSKPTPANENYSAINDIINEKVESVFNGEKRLEEIFDEKTLNQLNRLL